MSAFYFIYRYFGWPLLAVLLRIAALFIPKVNEGLKVRSRLPSGEKPWATGPVKPGAIWFHCASGEFEYAKSVITLLKRERPTLPVLVTYFSTSYQKAVQSFSGVDISCPLPWDTPKALKEFLNYHQPAELLIARTDVWPEMARQAHLRNLPSLLFSATLTRQSGRARGLGRWVSKATFSNLDSVFAVSDEDRAVFQSLGLKKTEIQKAGDTRYDQVLARLSAPKPLKESLFASGTPILVCGSTWPEDEAVLVDVIEKLQNRLRFILVPHESTSEHLIAIESLLADRGLKSSRYTQATTWTEGVLIVDTMGILAELYLKADFAFVGGSFKKNIHSVMEPLAAGCLTFVGPFHANNREALALKEISVSKLDQNLATDLHAVQPVNNSAELHSKIVSALQLPIAPLKTAIRAEIEARTGASSLVVNWILSRLES